MLTTWDGSAGAVTTSARLPSVARLAPALPMGPARHDDQIRALFEGSFERFVQLPPGIASEKSPFGRGVHVDLCELELAIDIATVEGHCRS